MTLRYIFEYLNGVPNTIWFDNDTSIVKIVTEENYVKKRIICDTFKRFKLHYDFKEVFLNVNRGYEKGTVEQTVRFMRRNLLVPLPSFDNFDEYTKELLDRCKKLLKREHYILKEPFIDLHFEDINELNPLPPIPFEPSNVEDRKLDNYGRLTTDSRYYYYLSPILAYEKVQVKFLPDTLEIYYPDGTYIMNVPRLSSSKKSRYINWSPYIRLLADKPAAMYNFSFLDLFTDQEVVEQIIKLNTMDLKNFLNRFADKIDRDGIEKAVEDVDTIL